MKDSEFLAFFNRFITECPEEKYIPSRKYVVMGDMHIGNGGSRDDMERNREIVQTILKRSYFDGGYTLILNGDVEDVTKFRYESVRDAWPELLHLFSQFDEQGRLRKIVGNHDFPLLGVRGYPFKLLRFGAPPQRKADIPVSRAPVV